MVENPPSQIFIFHPIDHMDFQLSGRIVNLSDPIDEKDAANKLYVDNLIENSAILVNFFKDELNSIQHPLIKEVRGKGLWIGVELHPSDVSAKDICKKLITKGIIAKETHQTVIRFAPPLMISKEQIEWAMEQIKSVFKDIP